jgi:diacylglycerol kinase (ATP)
MHARLLVRAMASVLESKPQAARAGAGRIRTPRRQVLLVANSHASRVRPELVSGLKSELSAWGAGCRTVVTESVEELAAVLADDAERRVVLVGGDGTLHAAANIGGFRPELALIAAGRANNVARSLGIPLDARAAARLAVQGHAHPIDLIEAVTQTVRYLAVEGVSAGFLSQARSHYDEENSGHITSALAAGATALAHFHPFTAQITHDGAVETFPLVQLFVANLPLYGFGLHVAPQADVSDGLLDVVAIGGRGRHDVVPMIVQLRRATALERSDTHHWRAETVRIETHGTLPVIADSLVLPEGPVDLGVLTDELPLVRP